MNPKNVQKSVRYQPVRAAVALTKLLRNPHRTEHVFEILSALEAGQLRRAAKRIRDTPARAHMRANASLLDVLTDREALRAMPSGSLAHAYLDFVDRENITADGLVAASLISPPLADPELQFTRDWFRDTHDLWHTVLGYQGDLVGESSVLAFGFAQTGGLGVGLISGAGWLQLRRFSGSDEAPRTVERAFRRGREAEYFPGVDWVAMLPRPIEEVRRELRVASVPDYRPLRVQPGQPFSAIATAAAA